MSTDQPVAIVEQPELKLIGLPFIGLEGMSQKYHCAKAGLLTASKHLPGVRNPHIHFELGARGPSQDHADTFAMVLCVEVDSHEGIPDWFLKITLPAQRCVVADGYDVSNGGFEVASAAVVQYLEAEGLREDAAGHRYTIWERYDYERGVLARYSEPLA